MRRIAFFVILIALWLFVCIYIAVAEITEHAGATEAKEDVWLTIEPNESIALDYSNEPLDYGIVIDSNEPILRLQTTEPNEPVLIFSDQPATIAEIVLSEDALDFTFRQDGEELNFNYSEPNVYTYDFEPEKAVSFIINALYKCWVSDEDVVVRYEPNEPKCEHKQGDSIYTCYHTDGSYCWQCVDCGETVNSKD